MPTGVHRLAKLTKDEAQVLGQAQPCRAEVVGQVTHRAVEGRCPP